jgi:CRISPR/Cas system-associated protein Csm6
MTYKLYNYDPSSSAAVAFAVIFGLSAAYHIWQVIRKRSWFFIPFVIGVMCKLPTKQDLPRCGS